MPDSQERQPSTPPKGPEEYLAPEERRFLQRYLSFPEEIPPKFKSWLIDFIAVNIPQIPISQIVGFDKLVYNRGTVFPVSPKDGQMFGYQVNADTIWQFRYDSGITDAYKWIFTGGPPLRNTVTSNQSTTSQGYVDLATVGPTLTVPVAGDYEIILGASLRSGSSTNAGDYCCMSYAVGGVGASDSDMIAGNPSRTIIGSDGKEASSRMTIKTGVAATTVIQAKYRTQAGGTFSFENRTLYMRPIRVSG